MPKSKSPPAWLLVLRRTLGLFFFIVGLLLICAGLRTVQVIADGGTGSAQGMGYAWTLHRSLAPRYATWARKWLDTKHGEKLNVHNISGTEWPLFGSVFFLEATASLQKRYQSASETEPMTYSREAVEAATELVLDPASAKWVKDHWGDKYLTHENAFYRMLVLRAIIAHHSLTGSKQHFDLLRSQIDGLKTELDASPAGLLDDYPGECFPGDIAATIAAIRAGSVILGEDSEAFVTRSLRGFTGTNVGELGLPPYFADRATGSPSDASRGCANSYLLLSAPVAWPRQAPAWYAAYERHFWQRDWLCAGFREFPHGGENWFADVDAGPVMHGIGFAAAAFGTGAARMNGRMDHAWPLEVETVAMSVPIPGGYLLIPRVLSNAADAPLLGEASVLYNLTRTPSSDTKLVPSDKRIPLIVWLVLVLEFGLGAYFCRRGWVRILATVARSPVPA